MKFRFWCAIATLLGYLILPAVTRAESVGTQVLSVFPENAREIGYVDLQAARNLAWFPQLKKQCLPSTYLEFEDFLPSIGINQDNQINGLVWAIGASSREVDSKAPKDSGELVGALVGQFDPLALETFYSVHKLRTSQFHGHTLFACGNETTCLGISFLFLDAATLVFGPPRSLALVIAAYDGEISNLLANKAYAPLISGINSGEVVFWDAMGPNGARQAISDMLPGAAQFSDAETLLSRVKATTVSIEGSGSLDTQFQIVSDTPETSAVLAQLLKAGILLQQYRLRQSDPDLAELLDEVHVTQKAELLKVRLSVPNDQIAAMVRRNKFMM